MKNYIILILLLIFTINTPVSAQNKAVFKQISKVLKKSVLAKADTAMTLKPITVTAESCERSAGGIHDFYSEGDYWWQNPDDPNGAYIQRDGQSNPNNFVAHRRAMVRFSQIIGALASAYLLTQNEKYVQHAFTHCRAWFIEEKTLMNPSLLYAQAIKGKATGRGIGIIDMIQMMEVAQGIKVMAKAKSVNQSELKQIKNWFSQYLTWVTTHQYGIDEREAKNNHGTCWVMQVAVFAKLTDNQNLIDYCKNRFKTVLLPNQMAENGSFPLELARTKPYGYALFNLDAMTATAHILSDEKESLWDFKLNDGRQLKQALDFMYPFIENKNVWTFKKDVMYWEEWPVAHPSLLFGFQKYGQKAWFNTWKRLEHFPQTEEVVRNLPIRFPLIWVE
jgi:hypothetical protein